MVTPVSQFITGLTSSLLSSVDFFEPPISSDTSFLPQDSSWGKYAEKGLQAARFFLPSLDMLMIGSELFTTMIVSVIPNADTEESHTGRNVLIGGALCLGLLAMARFGFGGSKFKWNLLTRASGGPKQVAREVDRAFEDLRLALRTAQPRSPMRLSFFDDQVWVCPEQEDLGRVLESVSEPGLLERLSQFVCAGHQGASLKYLHVTSDSKGRLVIFHPQSEHADMMRNLLREMPDARLRAAGRIQVVKSEVAIDIASKFNITANGDSLAYPTGMGGYHVMNDGQISNTVIEDAGLSGFDDFLKGIFGNSVNVKLEGNRAVDAFIRRQNN